MALITLAEAKGYLRVDHADEDAEIQRMVDQASALIVGYVTVDGADAWTDQTAPGEARSAAQMMVASLYDDRLGDPFKPGVKSMLRRLRDPSLA